MRRIGASLLAWLLAAPLWAATVKLPAPISYRVTVLGGDAAAASRFVNDVPTLSWYAQNRPLDLAPMLKAAHQTLDLHAAAAYATNTADLRRALVARADTSLFQAPDRLMTAVAADPALAPAAPAFAAASMEWDALSDTQRAAISKHGVTAEQWRDAALTQRVSALQNIYETMWQERSKGLTPGSPEYLALLRSFLAYGGSFLPPSKEAAVKEHLQKVHALHKRIAEARARIDALTDPVRAAMLDAVADAPDLDRANAALDVLFAGAVKRPAAAPEEVDDAVVMAHAPRSAGLTPAIVEAAAARLPALMRELSEGTEAAAMLDALDAGPVKTRVLIGSPSAGAIADYMTDQDLIRVNIDDLKAFLAWSGAPAEELLTHSTLLKRFALVVLPTYVHEATHRRQTLAADRKGIPRRTRAYLYSQSDEEEAFMAEALVSRRMLQRPQLRRWLDNVAAEPSLKRIMSSWYYAGYSADGIAAVVHDIYGATAGEHTARARAASYAVNDAQILAPHRAGLMTELARRKRLPAAERAALARLPMPSGPAALAAYPTRSLREMARRADLSSHAGLIRYYGYLDGLKRARSGLSAVLAPVAAAE